MTVLALLAVLVAGLVAPAAAQTSPIGPCEIYAGGGNRIYTDSARGYGMLVTSVAPGATAEAQVLCDINRAAAQRAVDPSGKTSHYFEMRVDGARAERAERVPPRWFIPIRTGENRVTVRFKDPKLPGEVSRTLTFPAWVYTVEPWAELQRPFTGTPQSETIDPRFMDAAGNLYAVLFSSDGVRGSDSVVKFAPNGSVATRYQLGPARSHVPLAVDGAGNLYLYALNNVVVFDASGKFVRSLGAVGANVRRVAGPADFEKGVPSGPYDKGSAFEPFRAVRQGAVVGGAIYLLIEAPSKPGTSGDVHLLGRLGRDGKVTVLATLAEPGAKSSWANGLVVGPDGNLYVGTGSPGMPSAVVALSPQGAVVRRIPHASGFAPVGMDAEGAFYVGHGCRRISPDGTRHSADLGQTRVLSRYSARHNQPLVTDLLTGQTLPELERGPITKATAVPRCWLHRGVVYALYPDRKVAKFTLQGGGTMAQDTAAAPVTAQPQAALTLKRIGGDFTQGVWLDGRTPVEFEAILTDAKGKPMPGVHVQLDVLDQSLRLAFGQKGAVGSPVTDAQGRVRGRYVPPRIGNPELARRAPVVTFKASAQPRGQGAPIEAFENAPAYPLLAGFLRVSRTGYVPLDQFPVELPSLRLGTVQGRVVFQASSTRFDSSATPAVERSSRDYRVVGAKVELMAEGRKIAEAMTDGAGAFQIRLSPASASAGAPSVALPDPIALTQYEAEVDARLLRVRRTLRTLADPKYGYKTDRIENALFSFPERFALAATEAAVEAEADALQRIGLLIAAVSASHELAEDSADRIIDTIAIIVADLVDVWDPGVPGQDKIGEVAKKLAPSAVAMIKKRVARLAVEDIEKGFGVLWHEGPWAGRIRLEIVRLLTGESQYVDADALKKKLASSFLGWYRADAEQALDRAARLYQARQLPAGRGEIGLILARYQRVVEHRDYVKNLQYKHEQVKAWSKLATDLVGNTIKVAAVLEGGAAYLAVAKIEEAIEKIQRGYSVLGDLPQLALWAEALTLGRDQIRQFSAVALGPE